jgi:hypothetical protein
MVAVASRELMAFDIRRMPKSNEQETMGRCRRLSEWRIRARDAGFSNEKPK